MKILSRFFDETNILHLEELFNEDGCAHLLMQRPGYCPFSDKTNAFRCAKIKKLDNVHFVGLKLECFQL
jgi:hypothetical protein